MITHIDLSSVLRRTVCELYSNLVTRPTGAAVRGEIELQLTELRDRTLTVIDFTNVGLLDFSCADEVVAKLLLRYGADDAPGEAYFLFRGLSESHLDAIESVLERHALALVLQRADGTAELHGTVTPQEREIWSALYDRGRVSLADLPAALGREDGDAEAAVDGLRHRRLVMRFDDAYVAVGATP
jgi:hypothetical protein